MKTRRAFLKDCAFMFGGLMLAGSSFGTDGNYPAPGIFMPEESELHERTWMAFIANDYIWEER